MYLGHSPTQFHVVFDVVFSTVPYMRTSELPLNWADLV